MCISVIAVLGDRFDIASINEEIVVNWYHYYLGKLYDKRNKSDIDCFLERF